MSKKRKAREGYGASSARFSTPDYGWIELSIDGLTPDGEHVRISEVIDPFDDLPTFLEAMAADEAPARWVIDEERQYVRLVFVPSVTTGISGGVEAQLFLTRDFKRHRGEPSHLESTRCFISPKDAALTIYAAYRTMADNPSRDPRHWEGMCGDYEEGEPGPTWSLSDIRSVTLDAMLEGKHPLT